MRFGSRRVSWEYFRLGFWSSLVVTPGLMHQWDTYSMWIYKHKIQKKKCVNEHTYVSRSLSLLSFPLLVGSSQKRGRWVIRCMPFWSQRVLWEYFHLGFWLSASGYTGNNASVRQVGIFSVYWNHFACLSVCPPVDVSEFVLLISPELLNVF